MVTLSQVDVGVDISKRHIDVCLYQTGKEVHIPNSTEGLTKLTKVLAQYQVRQIVCEATGGYESLMCKTLRALNYKVWRVQPLRIKAFIASEGIKAKTDKIDAKMIALFASQKKCAYDEHFRSENNEKLKNLVALKSSITASAAEIKTQLQQVSDPDCVQLLTQNLKFLEKQGTKLTVQIEQVIADDQDMSNKAKIMTSIPGIGDGTASTMLALLPELGTVNNKVAAALVGVAPYTRQSGSFKGQAKISGGRAPLRSILYMAALTAIKYNSKLAQFYQRLIASGKVFKVAIVAVMRKLVIYLNTLVKKGELWNSAI
jgi:transposase